LGFLLGLFCGAPSDLPLHALHLHLLVGLSGRGKVSLDEDLLLVKIGGCVFIKFGLFLGLGRSLLDRHGPLPQQRGLFHHLPRGLPSFGQSGLPLLLLLLERQKLLVSLEELLLQLQELVLEERELLPAAPRCMDETQLYAGGLFQILRASSWTVRIENQNVLW